MNSLSSYECKEIRKCYRTTFYVCVHQAGSCSFIDEWVSDLTFCGVDNIVSHPDIDKIDIAFAEYNSMIIQLRNCVRLLRSSSTLQVSAFSELSCCALSRKMASSAQGLIDFIHASPTPFHLVETAANILGEAGFSKLDERQSWTESIKAGGKYYYSGTDPQLWHSVLGPAMFLEENSRL